MPLSLTITKRWGNCSSLRTLRIWYVLFLEIIKSETSLPARVIKKSILRTRFVTASSLPVRTTFSGCASRAQVFGLIVLSKLAGCRHPILFHPGLNADSIPPVIELKSARQYLSWRSDSVSALAGCRGVRLTHPKQSGARRRIQVRLPTCPTYRRGGLAVCPSVALRQLELSPL